MANANLNVPDSIDVNAKSTNITWTADPSTYLESIVFTPTDDSDTTIKEKRAKFSPSYNLMIPCDDTTNLNPTCTQGTGSSNNHGWALVDASTAEQIPDGSFKVVVNFVANDSPLTASTLSATIDAFTGPDGSSVSSAAAASTTSTSATDLFTNTSATSSADSTTTGRPTNANSQATDSVTTSASAASTSAPDVTGGSSTSGTTATAAATTSTAATAAAATSTSSSSGGGGGGGGLSTGAIVGIVVGVVGGLALVGLAIFFFCRRRRRASSDAPAWVPHNGSMTPTNMQRDLAAEKAEMAAGSVEGLNHEMESLHASPVDSVGGAIPPVGRGAYTESQGSHRGSESYRGSYHDVPQTANMRESLTPTPGHLEHMYEPGMTVDDMARLEEEERRIDEAIAAAENRRAA